MKHSTNTSFSHCLRWLIAWLVLISLAAGSAYAETSALTPDDLSYENGNIVLHKHGERIGPDEWRVTVKATVGSVPVEKRKLEVVFLLDISRSMVDNMAHTHTDDCGELVCGKEEAEHSDECYQLSCGIDSDHTHGDYTSTCYTSCTSRSNPAHWNKGQHRSGYDCIGVKSGKNTNYYYLSCDLHEHSDDCKTLVCTDATHHTHDDDCYACPYYASDPTASQVDRLVVATVAAERLIASLPADTDITRLVFAGTNDFGSVSSYIGIDNSTGTYMWTAIMNTLSGDYFSENESKKIFVILTDGAATDENNTTTVNSANELLDTFKSTDTANGGQDGAVFTVGFGYNSDVLSEIAGNGGYSMSADDADSLEVAFDKIEQTMTAMLEDPMGTTVGFEKTSIQTVQTSGGSITSTDDTIYWHPDNDGLDTVRNSTIEYSYTVKLNDQADMTQGVHSDVALNNPTSFLYGIEGTDGATDMKSAAFPIPEAEYALSTIETRWQYNGQDIQDPLPLESVISDYADAEYIPAFQQDYQTITPVIPVPNSQNYYQYVGTTVTRTMQVDGAGQVDVYDSTDAVDATQPAAYVVIHQYELIEANQLAVGGTKSLIGRDFLPGDSFSFTLTAVTDGAPMPEGAASPQTVTITPESGTNAAFSFGTISYNAAGTYEYTIQEQAGTLDGVIYETSEHKLIVTVARSGTQYVASYTMDGVESGYLLIANRLQTGSLKVSKDTVTSHFPEHQEKEFAFLVSVKDASGHPLNGSYDILRPDGTTQTLTFANGMASATLKAGEAFVISGLPDGAAYAVTEQAMPGFTAASTGAAGTIEANQTREAVFDNTYQSAGRYQFIGSKSVDGATLAQDQFSFAVLDEEGNVVARGTNNADGSVFLDTLYFTQEDIGEKEYTIVEEVGSLPGYLYDRTRYEVTLTIMDNGDGTLSVADNLNGIPLAFINRYVTGQFTVSKTAAGNIGSKNQAFPFTISLPDMAGQTVSVSTDGGVTFADLTLDAQGTYTCTLKDGQSVIFYPVSGSYTVTETDPGSYTATYSIDQAAAVSGTVASGTLSEAGTSVTFVNTLEVPLPLGVHTSSASALMDLCLAACLIAITRMGRRCLRHDE